MSRNYVKPKVLISMFEGSWKNGISNWSTPWSVERCSNIAWWHNYSRYVEVLGNYISLNKYIHTQTVENV